MLPTNANYVMGACLDRWRTGSRKAKQCEVEEVVFPAFWCDLRQTWSTLRQDAQLKKKNPPNISGPAPGLFWDSAETQIPPHASSQIPCEALQHNFTEKKF